MPRGVREYEEEQVGWCGQSRRNEQDRWAGSLGSLFTKLWGGRDRVCWVISEDNPGDSADRNWRPFGGHCCNSHKLGESWLEWTEGGCENHSGAELSGTSHCLDSRSEGMREVKDNNFLEPGQQVTEWHQQPRQEIGKGEELKRKITSSVSNMVNLRCNWQDFLRKTHGKQLEVWS